MNETLISLAGSRLAGPAWEKRHCIYITFRPRQMTERLLMDLFCYEGCEILDGIKDENTPS
jgi:hypothetical protein